jgi:hypothetical protein
MASSNDDIRWTASVRLAALVVEIVWYGAWTAVVALFLASVLSASSPAVRAVTTKYGVMVRGGDATVQLPISIHYGDAKPDSAGSRISSTGSDGTRLVGHDDVIVALDRNAPLSFGTVRGLLAPLGLMWAAVGFWTLFQLRALLKSVRRGQPFDPMNPVRIRRIGVFVIAAGVLRQLLEWVQVAAALGSVQALVARDLPGARAGYHVSFDLDAVAFGLVILAIAEVFKVGVRLQGDQDLTV